MWIWNSEVLASHEIYSLTAIWSWTPYEIRNYKYFLLSYKRWFNELKTRYQNQLQHLCHQLVMKEVSWHWLHGVCQKSTLQEAKLENIQWVIYMTIENIHIPLWNMQPRWYCVWCVRMWRNVANLGNESQLKGSRLTGFDQPVETDRFWPVSKNKIALQ